MKRHRDTEVRKSIADYYRRVRARERAEREAVTSGLMSITFDQDHEVANLICGRGNDAFCVAKIPYADLPAYGLRVTMKAQNLEEPNAD